MDLQSLFGNLRNFEETKALRKEIMKDSHSNKSVALYSSKRGLSDSDESSEEDVEKYEKKLVESAALIVKHFHKRGDKKFGADRSFGQKSGYSGGRDPRSFKRPEKKEDKNCFNCGSPDHFPRDCKKKKDSATEESYEMKYKKLLASLKRQNVDVKAFVAEEEKETWEEEEASSEEEDNKDKCLMAKIDEEDAGKESSYDADLSEAARDSKMSDWDSTSLYQVKKFVTYSDNEKNNMFDYLCFDLSKSHSLNQTLKQTISALTDETKILELKLEDSNSKCRILTLTNDFLNKEKDQAINKTVKLQIITDNWATSHNNLNKILEAQIPHQCQKILGGDIDGAVDARNTNF